MARIIGHSVVVFGYWRVGTNLLISHIKQSNPTVFDFNEFFGNTVGYVEHVLEISDEEITRMKSMINDYFRLINDEDNVKHSVVKVMLPHTRFMEQKTMDMFNFKFFMYRSDFSKVIVSKIVAEKRKSWTNVGTKQPKFDSVIDIEEYETALKSVIDVYGDYANINLDADCFVNYEQDLDPYSQASPTYMKKSNNITIQNQNEIDLVYDKYKKQVDEICEHLNSRRAKKIKLPTALEILKYD